VYDISKAELELGNQWLNCSNGPMKQKLRKTGNEYDNGIMWESFVSVSIKLSKSETVVQEQAKKFLETGEK
jgi:hypothetical protein